MDDKVGNVVMMMTSKRRIIARAIETNSSYSGKEAGQPEAGRSHIGAYTSIYPSIILKHVVIL